MAPMTEAARRDGSDPRPSRVRRLLSRAGARRAEKSARAIVAELVARPPSNLRELERLVGRLDVDMAGPEGHGGGVFRPDSPFERPQAPAGDPQRGRLRRGIVRVFAAFDFDMYHGHPRTADQLRPNQLSLTIELDRAEVLRIAERALGSARVIDRDGREVLELGAWCYLEPTERPATLAWHRDRPDWALPPVAAGSPAAFLAALVAVLAEPSPPAARLAELAALGAAAGAAVEASERGLGVSARPGLPLPEVAAALGWDEPVAWSTNVHMSHWTVGPRDPATGGPARPRIGRWRIEAWLGGWPREAPRLVAGGASPVYDLRDHPGPVVGLLATADEGGELA